VAAIFAVTGGVLAAGGRAALADGLNTNRHNNTAPAIANAISRLATRVVALNDIQAVQAKSAYAQGNDGGMPRRGAFPSAKVALGSWKPQLLIWRHAYSNHRGLILPLANTTRPSTIVLFTRPVRICPDHGELLDLLKPAFAS